MKKELFESSIDIFQLENINKQIRNLESKLQEEYGGSADKKITRLLQKLLSAKDAIEEFIHGDTDEEVVVRCRFTPESSSGGRKSWAMAITGIASNTAKGVKAFDGNYLKPETLVDLKIGTLVLEVRPEGSVKHAWQSAWLLEVTETGLHEMRKLGDWRKDFLQVRDEIEHELSKRGIILN